MGGEGNFLLPSVIVLLQHHFKTFYKIKLIKTRSLTAMSHHRTVGKSLPGQLIAYQRHQEEDLPQAQESYELHDVRWCSSQRCLESWQTDQTLIPGLSSWFWCPPLSSLAAFLTLLQFCFFPVPNSPWWRYFLQPELLPCAVAVTCNLSNIKNTSLWSWRLLPSWTTSLMISSVLDLCSLSPWSLQIHPRLGCPLPDHNSYLA